MNNNDKSNKREQPELEIYDRTDFTSADAKYRALVEDGENDIQIQDHLSDYTGPWELSYTEAEIFDIDPDLLPALSCAYLRYECFIGSVGGYFEQYREQELINYAKHFRGELVNEIHAAVNFMVDACGLPALQCFGWVLKIKTCELRGGLFTVRQPEDQ